LDDDQVRVELLQPLPGVALRAGIDLRVRSACRRVEQIESRGLFQGRPTLDAPVPRRTVSPGAALWIAAARAGESKAGGSLAAAEGIWSPQRSVTVAASTIVERIAQSLP